MSKSAPSFWLCLILVLSWVNVSEAQRPQKWKEFNTTVGGFSVLMPETPAQTTSKINTRIGAIDLHSFEAQLEDPDAGVTVAYADYPPEFVASRTPKAMLDGARDRAVESMYGKLLTEALISIGSYPGRDISASVPGGYAVFVRIYLVKNRLYQVVVAVPKDHAFDAWVGTFLDSFKLQSR